MMERNGSDVMLRLYVGREVSMRRRAELWSPARR
jgi:hypothetical protein